jgi:uncharacterized protein
MSLSVNLRHLEAHSLRLKGELPVEELDLDPRDEVIRVVQPLEYDLEVQKVDKSLLVQGRLHLDLECQCVRCLKSFRYDLDLSPWTCHLPLQGEERAEVVNDCVELTPYIREDILLEFPRHPVCGPECRGLPKRSVGESRNTSTAGRPGMSLPAWAELNKLKL